MTNVLIGKTLTGIKIADDKHALLFQMADGDIIARTDGDCCSHTWIENVELPARGFPCVVSGVVDLDMPDLGSPSECECIAYYGCKIITDNGDIVIDYRNESNGYYGGNLSWPGEHYYGGVSGQNESTENWVEVSP